MTQAISTISQVSQSLGISTRMLRYYEQVGLVQSRRIRDYAYRVYDEEAVERLRQILILRRLRIPVKQIQTILLSGSAVAAMELFMRNIRELDTEIAALSTIRGILNRFVEELRKTADVPIRALLTQDEPLLASIASLTPISINHKEDQTMNDCKGSGNDTVLLKDVRILYLPPATVAAAHYIGDDPEAHVSETLDRFVRESSLLTAKPDLRHYGFNHPNPVDETGFHGYEMWVTIPDSMEVPAPLTKKRFPGGLYAAHTIAMGEFDDWMKLFDWVNASEKYQFAGDMQDQEHMCSLLEEHLNYISHVKLMNTEPEDMQLDLLMPVKER
jgi:DNA-binding transcriptional MerR regulator/DNA gyrase inhibitor GyrI